MKASTQAQAQAKWARNGNTMVAFAPNICPHEGAPKDRWILADKWNVLATGFSLEDCESLRDRIKRAAH